ncbi:hypothetical protein CEXT_168121 [Caerostris extrusa]|uniref:Uncharacterized protein n=1 Tax=Caerostris extrusa TaxID=172846 RepID=A0AAV4N0K8_CAEEX|nr:hypothetical protein CEXT_168121 [Caerostris extrusa]
MLGCPSFEGCRHLLSSVPPGVKRRQGIAPKHQTALLISLFLQQAVVSSPRGKDSIAKIWWAVGCKKWVLLVGLIVHIVMLDRLLGHPNIEL